MPAAPPGTTLIVAFDGSLNALWVTRYALRMAAATPGSLLLLVHVAERGMQPALVEVRVAQLLAECENAGVRADYQARAAAGGVTAALLAAVPRGDALLLCGARARTHGRGLLAGTVAEQLLRAGRCPTLALRVLTPGLLGRAARLMLATAGWPGESRGAAPFLRPLLRGSSELHLLRVMEARPRVLDHAPRADLERLRAHGRAAVTHSEGELRAALELGSLRVDTHVRLDVDWPRAASVVARVHHCNLLLAGGSDRQLRAAAVGSAAVERLLAAAPCDVGIFRTAG